MGKIATIVVIGFAVIIGVIGTALNRRSNDNQKNSVSAFEKIQARNIAKSATEIYKLELKKNPSLKGKYSLQLMGGNATVTVNEKIPGKREKLGISTEGTYGNATKDITLDATKGALQAPPVTGALGVSYLSKAKLNFGKGTNIDGNNHDMSGALENTYSDVAGLSLGHPDQLANLDYKPKDAKIKGKGIIDPNIEVQTPQPDYYEWAMKLAEGADVTYNAKDVKSVETLGTPANPQVTYVIGNTKFNENTTGAGILIIDGNCKFNKSFDFVGLVFVVGDSLTSEKATMGKGSSIIGAMMVAGKKTNVKTGDVDILFSGQAVNQVLGLVPGHMPDYYVFSNWKE